MDIYESEGVEGPLGARSKAVEQLLRYRSGAPIGSDLEPDLHFADIGAKLVYESESKRVSYVTPTGAEPMRMKEMRSVLRAFRTRLKRPSNWGKGFLFVGDNLGVVFAISKVRCTHVVLLHLQRTLAAYTLATGSAGGAMGLL